MKKVLKVTFTLLGFAAAVVAGAIVTRVVEEALNPDEFKCNGLPDEANKIAKSDEEEATQDDFCDEAVEPVEEAPASEEVTNEDFCEEPVKEEVASEKISNSVDASKKDSYKEVVEAEKEAAKRTNGETEC